MSALTTPTSQPTTDAAKGRRSRRSRVFGGIRTALAIIGAVLMVAIAVGAIVDIANIDRTSGGYEPPYASYTGDPIDWDADTYTTPTGMVATGYVLDVYTDCTTGMISFEILGLVSADYRQLSDRALAVHKPQSACVERGFDPEF